MDRDLLWNDFTNELRLQGNTYDNVADIFIQCSMTSLKECFDTAFNKENDRCKEQRRFDEMTKD